MSNRESDSAEHTARTTRQAEGQHQEHLEDLDDEYTAEYRYRLYSDGSLTREKICEECGYVVRSDELQATELRVLQNDRVIDQKGGNDGV